MRKIRTTIIFENEVDPEYVDESFADEDVLEQFRATSLEALSDALERDELTIKNEFVYAE